MLPTQRPASSLSNLTSTTAAPARRTHAHAPSQSRASEQGQQQHQMHRTIQQQQLGAHSQQPQSHPARRTQLLAQPPTRPSAGTISSHPPRPTSIAATAAVPPARYNRVLPSQSQHAAYPPHYDGTDEHEAGDEDEAGEEDEGAWDDDDGEDEDEDEDRELAPHLPRWANDPRCPKIPASEFVPGERYYVRKEASSAAERAWEERERVRAAGGGGRAARLRAAAGQGVEEDEDEGEILIGHAAKVKRDAEPVVFKFAHGRKLYAHNAAMAKLSEAQRLLLVHERELAVADDMPPPPPLVEDPDGDDEGEAEQPVERGVKVQDGQVGRLVGMYRRSERERERADGGWAVGNQWEREVAAGFAGSGLDPEEVRRAIWEGLRRKVASLEADAWIYQAQAGLEGEAVL